MNKRNSIKAVPSPETWRQKDLRLQLEQILKEMFSISAQLNLTMLNSMFNENYEPATTEILLTYNERSSDYKPLGSSENILLVNLHGEQYKKSIHKKNRYQIDFQTSGGQELAIRFFAYGFIKFGQSKKDSGRIIIIIPKQYVIYVEEREGIDDTMNFEIVDYSGNNKNIDIPIMKFWEYTVPDLVENRMYPLLPLQLLQICRKLKQARAADSRAETRYEYEDAAKEVLQIVKKAGTEFYHLYREGVLTLQDFTKMMQAMKNLIFYITNKYIAMKQFIMEIEEMMQTITDRIAE